MAKSPGEYLAQTYKDTWSTFWERKKLFLSLSFLLFYVPMVIWQVLLIGLMAMAGWSGEEFTGTTGMLGALIVVYLLGLIVMIALQALMFIGITRGSETKKTETIGESIGNSLGVFWRYIGLAALLSIIFVPLIIIHWGVPIGLILLSSQGALHWAVSVPIALLFFLIGLIPAIFLTVKLYFSTYALVLDNLGVVASMKKAWNITKNKFWWTVLFLFLFLVAYFTIWMALGLIVLLPLSLLQMGLNLLVPLLGDLIYTVISGIISALILPLAIIYLAKMYTVWKKV